MDSPIGQLLPAATTDSLREDLADPGAPASRRFAIAGAVVVFAAVFLLSWFGDHYTYLSDDGGITLRYAERIAAGRGFNYNDGEAVNGASSPLFVLLEAALLRTGMSPRTVIFTLASVCLATSAAVLFATFARHYSVWVAVVSVLALGAFQTPMQMVADGMETPIVGLLVVLLFHALHGSGYIYPAIVLGLLVANKLDGAMATIAYAIVYVFSRRAFPRHTAAVALLAAAPVLLVLLWSFGSILPNSMLVKLTIHAEQQTHWKFDPLWMHQQLSRPPFGIVYYVGLASLLWLPLTRRLAASVPVLVIQAWFLIHMLTFASVSLGDRYPWYAAAPEFHSVILATTVVHWLGTATLELSGLPRVTWGKSGARVRSAIVGAGVVAAICMQRYSAVVDQLRAPRQPMRVPGDVTWNLARQSIGVWLRQHSSGTELMSTFEGLPSFEYGGPVYDHCLLNSKLDQERRASAAYEIFGPEPLDNGAALPMRQEATDRRLVASFRYDAADGFYLLYAKTDSEIFRRGIRHFVFPTPVLEVVEEPPRAGRQVPQVGNTWLVPVDCTAKFSVKSPSPPMLLFSPVVALTGRRPARAVDSVRVSVRTSDQELLARDYKAGAPPGPLSITIPVPRKGTKYAVLITCTYTGSGNPSDVILEARDVLVRCGDPPRSSDFKVMYERASDRIDYVAGSGLPYQLYGW
jgi:hypothetical protein